MKGKLVLAIAVILLLIGSLPHGSVGASEAQPKRTQEAQHRIGPKGRLESPDIGRPADRLITEARSGYAVELRARQLRVKNKPMARAMRDLEKRGLKPAFDKGLSIVAIDKEKIFRKTGTAAQNVVEGDYELTFMPYDNGNSNTWEGLVYFTGGGNNDVDYVLLSISPEGDITVSAEQNYSNNGSGGGGGGGELQTQNRLRNPRSLVRPASNATANMQWGRYVGWIICFVSSCSGSIGSCRDSGGFWLFCALLACVHDAIDCANNAF